MTSKCPIQRRLTDYKFKTRLIKAGVILVIFNDKFKSYTDTDYSFISSITRIRCYLVEIAESRGEGDRMWSWLLERLQPSICWFLRRSFVWNLLYKLVGAGKLFLTIFLFWGLGGICIQFKFDHRYFQRHLGWVYILMSKTAHVLTMAYYIYLSGC